MISEYYKPRMNGGRRENMNLSPWKSCPLSTAPLLVWLLAVTLSRDSFLLLTEQPHWMTAIRLPGSASSGYHDAPGALTQTPRAARVEDSEQLSFIFQCNVLIKWYQWTALSPNMKPPWSISFCLIQRIKHKSVNGANRSISMSSTLQRCF